MAAPLEETHDPGRGLPWLPAMQFASKSTAIAQCDRIYSERHSVPAGNKATLPVFPSTTVRATRFVIGTQHPKYSFAYLYDAYVTSRDNEMENWTVLYRIDMLAYCTAAGLTFPDVLSKDGFRKSDEYGADHTTINWQFVVVNPDNYVEPAYNTAHPDHATAKLVAQALQRDGIIGFVSRRYEKLAALTTWTQDEETRKWISTTKQIVFATGQPADPGAGVELTRHELGSGFSLDITRTINGGNEATLGYEYADYIDFERPRLMTDVETLTLDSEYRFDLKVDSGYVKKIPGRIEVDFQTSNPSPSALFQMFPVDWAYNGFGFRVHENNLITDEWDFGAISSTSVELLVARASDPTYTEYVALIGDEVLYIERCTKWRFGLWRRQQVYIILE